VHQDGVTTAIYRLAEALRRLGQFDFPIGLNAVTRAFFESMASAEPPSTADAMRALLASRTDDEVLNPPLVHGYTPDC
jgi:hypothetical protein